VARSSTAFDHLPDAIRVLIPELTSLDWPAEVHADCERCPMVGDHAPHPWSFNAETRCCTAHPELANFLVGRALRRGDPGRTKLLDRLRDLDGVSAWGIDPQPWRRELLRDRSAEMFGRDLELRCPYWIGGDHSCGIWHDRSGICRTWYCRHEDGVAGAVSWQRMQGLMFEVESRLAVWAIEHGDPPDEPATAADYAAWFERAAVMVSNAPAAQIAPLATEVMRSRRDEIRTFVDIRQVRRRRGMARVLVPSVSDLTRTDDGDALITGYSSFDAVRAPAAVFELLSRLDGKRTWKKALAEAREATGEPRLDEALVASLHRVGAVRDPKGRDDLPYSVDLIEEYMWSRARGRGT
jgi:hypothetical protein